MSEPDNTDPHDLVWNSGNFEFAAGVTGAEELGPEWERVAKQIHALSTSEAGAEEAYEKLVEISCAALVEVARSGLLGECGNLQFNVSETTDDLPIVEERNALVHSRLRTTV